MKAVILAGGMGTRISEESQLRPKPMVEIGGQPILWHIMKIYSKYNINDFIICGGYKVNVIKDYFANYFLYTSDVTFDFRNKNDMTIHRNKSEPWKVTIIDTGLNTMTGGRIKRIEEYVKGETFMLTYGDGLSDINLDDLLISHKKGKGYVTLTAIQPEGRFGQILIDDTNRIDNFFEKPKGDGNWINGGFFVCEPEIFNYIEGDDDIWERQPIEKIASEKKLYAYKHIGFWRAMDTLREKNELEELWSKKTAPWKIW